MNRTWSATTVLGAGLGLALGAGLACGAGVQPVDAGAQDSGQAAQQREPSAQEVSSARERAIEMLTSLTRHENAAVRANALEGLAETPARIEPLVRERLMDGNEGVRSVAAMIAGRLRLTGVTEELRRARNDSSAYVRASAIYALRRCGAEVDPTALAGILLNDPEPRVRSHAAFILGELGDASALGLLRQASGDPMHRASPRTVRLMKLQIAEAMIKLGDEDQLSVVRAALYPASPEELEATALAVQILGEVEDRGAIEQLIQLSRSSAEVERAMPAEVRLGAAGSLAKLGQRQGAFIADEYREHENAAIRAQAAAVYGETGKRRHLGVLEGMLEDRSVLVQVSAASSVVQVASWGRGRANASERWQPGG